MFHQEQSKIKRIGNSLVVQWLGFLISTAGGMGSILGLQIKISQVAQCSQKKKKKIKRTNEQKLPCLDTLSMIEEILKSLGVGEEYSVTLKKKKKRVRHKNVNVLDASELYT